MSRAPKEQFSPIDKISACCTEARNAPSVCPDKVRPPVSERVTESMIGIFFPLSCMDSTAAYNAALALRVSKIVSMRSKSTPPSMSAVICSRYASARSSNVNARKAGLLTSGDMEQVLLVGPTEPATNRGLSGIFLV
ncbi:unknown [Bacteroides sp. CAG:144]|nr:unknown [Bacteroides sp. CAG:144]